MDSPDVEEVSCLELKATEESASLLLSPTVLRQLESVTMEMQDLKRVYESSSASLARDLERIVRLNAKSSPRKSSVHPEEPPPDPNFETKKWLFPLSEERTLYSSEDEADCTSSTSKLAQETPLDPVAAPDEQSGKIFVLNHPDEQRLIHGLVFSIDYVGSTHLFTKSTINARPTKYARMKQAQEALEQVDVRAENAPRVPVNIFLSVDKIIILNIALQEIIMDHDLKSVAYIADIDDVLVVMIRRCPEKTLCHVFRTDQAQLIAHAIGQAFNIAYQEFLRANNLSDPRTSSYSGGSEIVDYQEVLNQQEIFGDEIDMFADKTRQKEIIISKGAGESLGIAIVESGYGSMLPTVIIAKINPSGPAARSGQLNIGNQIMTVNNQSLVGLPLAQCESVIKLTKNQSAVRLVIVESSPVIEVLIKRPDKRFALGFSVQDGVICSVIRGGIAERGGVRIGHRIIEINGQSVVATEHEMIVAMLSNAIGEIYLRTMPYSMFRLLTAQDEAHYI